MSMNHLRSLSCSGNPRLKHRQRGLTLMETMISLALSLIVTTAMVTLMANSLGSASKIIQMSQLTDELRKSMQLMSRDVRRANYAPNALYCFSNSDCASDAVGVTAMSNINIDDSDATQVCMTFELNRFDDSGNVIDSRGGFRRNVVASDFKGGNVGVIEMWIADTAPNCATDTNWVRITDQDFVDITTFSINDNDSFTQSIEAESSTLSLTVRQIKMEIAGELVLDDRINRRIEDTIRVRNDYVF
jgi:Tfp pilus assembly protein PilV